MMMTPVDRWKSVQKKSLVDIFAGGVWWEIQRCSGKLAREPATNSGQAQSCTKLAQVSLPFSTFSPQGSLVTNYTFPHPNHCAFQNYFHKPSLI